jgi:hypothetical protein
MNFCFPNTLNPELLFLKLWFTMCIMSGVYLKSTFLVSFQLVNQNFWDMARIFSSNLIK